MNCADNCFYLGVNYSVIKNYLFTLIHCFKELNELLEIFKNYIYRYIYV